MRVIRHWQIPQSDVVDDLVQEIFLKLSSNEYQILKSFSRSHGTLEPYLSAVAANVVRDYFRAAAAQKRSATTETASLDDLTERRLSDQSKGESLLANNVFLSEIDYHLRALSDKERTIFWLYYRQGLTAKEIAAVSSLELTEKGVESVIHRVTGHIRRSLASKAPRKSEGTDAQLKT
jgi:RNA polymerase sigma-70 factor, ECF subfamily